jgi:hypothetical protein
MGFHRFMRRGGFGGRRFGGFGGCGRSEEGPKGCCPIFGANPCETKQQQCPQTECKQTQAQAQTAEKETSTEHKPASIPVVPKPEALNLADKYEVQLNALQSMGFNNRDLCIYMLERFNGNVQQVANWLLEKMKQ